MSNHTDRVKDQIAAARSAIASSYFRLWSGLARPDDSAEPGRRGDHGSGAPDDPYRPSVRDESRRRRE